MSLSEIYNKDIAPKLLSEFGLKNKMALPYIQKIVLNTGIGDAKDSKEEQQKAVRELAAISGQKPKATQARQSIASFGVRKGQPVGLSVTLRARRMYEFLEKLIKIVLPRIRDFRGVSPKSFDASGNFTLGIPEHTVFPEIDLGKISKTMGLEITIVIKNGKTGMSRRLLEELGMPFEKESRRV